MKAWEKRIERIFNITGEEYRKVLAFQGGACGICGRKPTGRRLAIDHSHRTGLVRGLLCMRCNKGLAWFSDLADRLGNAKSYLLNPPVLTCLGPRYARKGPAVKKRRRHV